MFPYVFIVIGLFAESHVRDAVLQNALTFHGNHDHCHHDEDFELQGALLSVGMQHQASEAIIALTETDDHTNTRRSRFRPNVPGIGCATVDPLPAVVPLLLPVALPLNEQISGDSQEWMADLWSSTRNDYNSLLVEQPAPSSVPRIGSRHKRKSLSESTVRDSARSMTAGTDKMKRIRSKVAPYECNGFEKAKLQLSPGQAHFPPPLQFQEQLSGDSRVWENFTHHSEGAVNIHTTHGISLIPQKHRGFPHMTACIPTAPRLPSKPCPSQLVDTIAAVPFDHGPLLTTSSQHHRIT